MSRFIGENRVDIAGHTYTLRIDFNALAAFEDVANKSAFEAFEDLEKGKARAGDLRGLLFSALRKHHPEKTLEDAGDLFSEDTEAAIEALRSTVASASPESEKPGETQLGNVQGARRRAR